MRQPKTEHNTSRYIIHGFYAEEKSKNASNRRNRANIKTGDKRSERDAVSGQKEKRISSIIQGDSVKKALIFHGTYE